MLSLLSKQIDQQKVVVNIIQGKTPVKEGLEVCVCMLVDKVKDWRTPGFFCALDISQEGEPEESAETDVDGPQPPRHEFEVDSLKDGPNQDPRLGRKEIGLEQLERKVLEKINGMI